MIIEVTYPMEDKNTKHRFDVEQGLMGIGDIVIIDNEEVNQKYGVVTRINLTNKQKLNNKNVKLVDELERVLFWTDLETKLLRNGVNATKKSLNTYRLTKGNERLSDEQIKVKLTRNLLLVHRPYRIPITKNGHLILHYGCLRITYNNGIIYNLHNHSKFHNTWTKNIEKYNHYTKLLGIEV